MKIKYLLFLLLVIHSSVYSKNTFFGVYTQNESPHEEVSTLMVLPNNTFCFSYMGGDLDMLLAGKWTKEKNQISFREEREKRDHYHASIHYDKNIIGKNILLNGYTFSKAKNTIFAISQTASQPNKFKLFFEPDYNGWSRNYTIPLENDHNKSIFIGKAIKFIDDGSEQRKILYKVYEFTLNHPDANILYFAYDRDSDRKIFDFTATLKNGKINFNPYFSYMKKVDDLTSEDIAKIDSECIKPRLNRTSSPQSNEIKAIQTYEIVLPIPQEYYFKTQQNDYAN